MAEPSSLQKAGRAVPCIRHIRDEFQLDAAGQGIVGEDIVAFRDSVLARIPRGRLGEISDIGAAVQYLASDHADMASGAVLFIDGGWTIV